MLLCSELRNEFKRAFRQGTMGNTSRVDVSMFHIQMPTPIPTFGARERDLGIWGPFPASSM